MTNYHGQVYCPLNDETNCGYWVCFGGHLDPFVKEFKRHVSDDHTDLPYSSTRMLGGIIDRWIGDLVVEYSQKREVPEDATT